MLALFGRVFVFGLIVAVICMVAAFFSNETFTATCTNQLLDCLPKGNEKWYAKILIGFKCVFQNLWCVGREFISIFK